MWVSNKPEWKRQSIEWKRADSLEKEKVPDTAICEEGHAESLLGHEKIRHN